MKEVCILPTQSKKSWWYLWSRCQNHTLKPSWAALMAATYPPGPEPTTVTSASTLTEQMIVSIWIYILVHFISFNLSIFKGHYLVLNVYKYNSTDMIRRHLTWCFISIRSHRQDCGSMQLGGEVLTSLYCTTELYIYYTDIAFPYSIVMITIDKQVFHLPRLHFWHCIWTGLTLYLKRHNSWSVSYPDQNNVTYIACYQKSPQF